jgi:hypothetical protein
VREVDSFILLVYVYDYSDMFFFFFFRCERSDARWDDG